MYRVLATALLAAISVSALSISSACQNALGQVAINSDANACLDVSALLSVALNPNASIITPVDNMLKSLCSAQPCSNATLSAVVTNITTGCSAEISTVNSTSSSSELISLVQEFYPTVRQIVCLTDSGSSGTNCVTETLTNLQNAVGTLSLDTLENVFTNGSAIPSNIQCTDCVKTAFHVLNESFPNTASSAAGDLQLECGSGFTDGSTPSDIKESAATASTGSNSASATATILSRGALAGVTACLIVVGSSLWAFLA